MNPSVESGDPWTGAARLPCGAPYRPRPTAPHGARDPALTVAHLDCDAFFAAVEKRNDPSLMDRPVIIGGGARGVVATACYQARRYGVRSAMPMFKARAACPDAMVVRPNMVKYRKAASQIRALMDAVTPLVQPVSVDEAYLDLSGTERLHGGAAADTLLALAARIEETVGVTVSIGLSVNKFLAKTGSEEDKPRGFTALQPDAVPTMLWPRPIGALHGVGPRFAARLIRDGFVTVGDAAQADAGDLARRYGEAGLMLRQRANGADSRRVAPGGARKSISAETTFRTDLSRDADLERVLWPLCVRVSDRAKAAGMGGRVVTLKLKRADHAVLTRRVTLAQPSQLAGDLDAAARRLLAQRPRGARYRLIGVGLSDLADHLGDPADLFDPDAARRAAAERAGDAVRARFGPDALVKGRGWRGPGDEA